MRRGVLQCTICAAVTGVMLTGNTLSALASNDTTLAGFASVSSAETQDVCDQTSDSSAQTSDTLSGTAQIQQYDSADYSLSGELAFAQCEEYINIRSSASSDGEIVGKVYNNGSVTILSQVGDWYEIKSGNVTGYVKAEYFAVGEQAQAIAEEVGYEVATVYPEALKVRAEASEDAEVIGMVYSEDELEVVATEGDWTKVILSDGTYGYVSSYYVDYNTYYATAETLQEEQERLDQEWLDYLAQQQQAQWDAEYQAQSEAQSEAEAAQQEQWNTEYQESQEVVEAQEAADTAYQTYLAAQEAADAATQQADVQAALDAAAEAVEAYQAYVEAQTIADEKAQSEADAQYAAQQAASQTAAAETETTAASEAQAAADEAYQVYLAAQEAADAATQQADTQAVLDTAAEAVEAYQAYVEAQTIADEKAQSEADAQYAAQQTASQTTAAETEAAATDGLTGSEAQAAADEAYQVYLAAQEAADAATQQTDTQKVLDTAAEAVEAYQAYLDAQQIADEQKQSEADAAYLNQQTQTETEAQTSPETNAQTETEAPAETEAQQEQTETEAETQASSSSSSSLGQSIVNFAIQFVGYPYVYGGTSLTGGADCSGFTQSVFANFGISIPRVAADQANSGTAVSLSEIQAGDLLFYSDGSGISHVSIYMGNGQVVHASSPSAGIIISDYSYRTPVCARRYW